LAQNFDIHGDHFGSTPRDLSVAYGLVRVIALSKELKLYSWLGPTSLATLKLFLAMSMAPLSRPATRSRSHQL